MSSADRARKLQRAKRMVALLETALYEQAESGGGVVSVTIDGMAVSFSQDAAQKQLEWWEKQVSRFSPGRSRFHTARLDGC
jgi:hypothetical protein